MTKFKSLFILSELSNGEIHSVPLNLEQINSVAEYIKLIQGGEFRVLKEPIKELKDLIKGRQDG